MTDSLWMTIIQPINELFEIISCNRLFKRSCMCYEIKKFTTSTNLKSNKINIPFLSRLFTILACSPFNLFYNILMFKLFHNFDFIGQQLHSKVVFTFHNLDSNLPLILTFASKGKLNFTRPSSSQSPKNLIVINWSFDIRRV